MGIRELEDKASSIIDRVEQGEAITVTKHGRPVARIVSTTTPPHLSALIADSTVRPPRGASLRAGEAGQTPGCGQERGGGRLRGSALSLYLDTSALIKLPGR